MPSHSLRSLCSLLFNLRSLLFNLLFAACAAAPADAADYDVVIYGGTSAGVAAGVQAARMDRSVVIIEPRDHVGGLTISGLGRTDSGNKSVIGGVSREFYQRVKSHYDDPAAWRQERQADYGSYRAGDDAIWMFEPHVAEQTFRDMLDEAGVPVVTGKRLDRDGGVSIEHGRITAIVTDDGTVFQGRCFIDATYEGDLMAAAGVSYTVGREANSQYGETLNGVQKGRAVSHQFVRPVDPFIVPGVASSGVLPGISVPGVNDVIPEDGEADHRVQAYNYRICMTDNADNQAPFEKPAGYEPIQHELLFRNFEAGDLRLPMSIGMLPNRKTDLNNNFAVSSDYIGMNYAFPEASYEERERILAAHETYIRGFLWALANHPRVPEEVRRQAGRWGYAKDEFVDNDHWPYWCYIREARRMVSDYVQTEHDCRRSRMCDDPVGMGSYNMDSHNCQRYIDETGHVRNEGDIQVSPRGPYLISYRAIVPKREECTNLFVPVCLSASHIAYGSIRMEPVFMILGQSAATAASMSLDQGIDIQDVDYEQLRARLLADRQVLDIPAGSVATSGIPVASLEGIVVDDVKATKTGTWQASSSAPGFVGDSYLHDGNEQQGEKTVEFELPIEKSGEYDVRLAWSPHVNRATAVRVRIRHADGETDVTVNQRQKPEIRNTFHSLGTFRFDPDRPASVTISNRGANGYVIADAVWLVPAP